MDVLKDKQYKQYDRFSRYSPFPVFYNSLEDKYVVGITANLSTSTNFLLYKVKEGDTYDSIALRHYNNPTYYWVICDFNRVRDPFNTPVPGTELKIPVISTLMYEV